MAQKHGKRLAREEVSTLDEQWRSAILADDIAAMDKLLSDDYLGITGTGQAVTKLQQLDRMRSRSIALTRFDVSDVKVKLVGAVAIVTSIANIDGMMDAKPTHGSFRSTRVYQKLANGAWKLTNFEATRVHNPRGQAAIEAASQVR
ncbi:nuclear transport factor 2 family protein [Bryocella elongata]|uniref:nuclear transport factor 2 family protein n=1 Tax=Bryocella elongata TaxID=863522 RepID=UPI001357A185|nr:nuclear transport factor 2 family protein [Bryocella elongata]